METVMFIDDNVIDQKIFRRILQRTGLAQNVLSFHLVRDALDYLRSAETEMPDVIFLDINMPVMDGFDFLEILEDEFGVGLVPIVVMLTTSLDPQDVERAKQFASVKEFINKPLTDAILRKVLSMSAPVSLRPSARPAAWPRPIP